MSIIHRTTLSPTKLELLTAWLPTRPWYAGAGREPELTKAGGFRLDDPAGEVGIEFMVVHDAASGRTYQAPMTYRAAPLDGGDDALIRTLEHGVLGRRWVYDAPRDPVFVAALFALLSGTAVPQEQSIGDTPNPAVTATVTGVAPSGPAMATDEPDATHLTTHAREGDAVTVILHRVLTPGPPPPHATGHISAPWQETGREVRGVYATVHAPKA